VLLHVCVRETVCNYMCVCGERVCVRESRYMFLCERECVITCVCVRESAVTCVCVCESV